MTITLLIGFVYYGMMYSIFFRRRQNLSSWNHHDYSYYSCPNPTFHTNGTNDYDDVHNFDYMDDLIINDEENDDTNQDDSSDWVPLYNDDDDDTNVNNETCCTPADHRQRHSDNSFSRDSHPPNFDFVDDEDDNGLFFDTIPFLPDSNYRRYDSNGVTPPIIDGNALPIDESKETIGINSTIHAEDTTTICSSVLMNGTITTVPTRADTVVPMQCERKSLNPQQQQRPDNIAQNDAINSAMMVPIDNVPLITSQMVATQSNHTNRMNGATTSSMVTPFTREVRPHNDIICTDGITTNGSNISPNQPHECTLNEKISRNNEINDKIQYDVPPISPSRFHSMTTLSRLSITRSSSEHHPEPSIDVDITTRIAPLTDDVDGKQMIQLLWSELKYRNHTAAGRKDSPIVEIDNHMNRSNDGPTNEKDCNHKKGNRDDGMIYQEYPFLALLNW